MRFIYDCLDCSNKIDKFRVNYKSNRCNSCYRIYRKIISLHRCMKCCRPIGKSIYHGQICRRCSNLGENNPNYGNGEKISGNKNPNYGNKFGMNGDRNGRWKGGVCQFRPLRDKIGQLKQTKRWKLQVFRRDNFTCQDCGIIGNGKNLHCHHIKEMSTLYKEFLQQYSQFSPIDDEMILLKLAETHEPFYDLNNGQTLCEACHKLTANWGYKGKC